MRAFSAAVRGRSVEPVKVSRLIMIGVQSISTFEPLQESDLHQAAIERQAAQVARDVVAADHVEDHVDAAVAGEPRHLGHEILLRGS